MLSIEIQAKILPFEADNSKIIIQSNVTTISNTDFDNYNTLHSQMVCLVMELMIFLSFKSLKWKGNIQLSLEMVCVTCTCLTMKVQILHEKLSVCYYVSWSTPVKTMVTRGVSGAMVTSKGCLSNCPYIAISTVQWTETSGSWTCQLNCHIGSTFGKSLNVSYEANCMDLSVKTLFTNNTYKIWITK